MPIVNDLPKQSAPYVPLTWIQGQGGQWIDAGITPSGYLTDFEIKWNNMRATASGVTDMTMFGCRTDYNKYQFQLTDYVNSSWNVTGAFGMSADSLAVYDLHYAGNTDIVTSLRDEVLTTGTGYTVSVPHQSFNALNGNRMYIFALNTNGSVSEKSTFKLYYFKIWQNGLLIRDFIPVRKLSNNEVCLYDKVGQIFYTNQGTGSFLGG